MNHVNKDFKIADQQPIEEASLFDQNLQKHVIYINLWKHIG